MLNHDIVREATRLTRSGQLVEATAVLQRMLRRDSAPQASRSDPELRSRGWSRRPSTCSHRCQRR